MLIVFYFFAKVKNYHSICKKDKEQRKENLRHLQGILACFGCKKAEHPSVFWFQAHGQQKGCASQCESAALFDYERISQWISPRS